MQVALAPNTIQASEERAISLPDRSVQAQLDLTRKLAYRLLTTPSNGGVGACCDVNRQRGLPATGTHCSQQLRYYESASNVHANHPQ